MGIDATKDQARIVIAGGGFAAVEAALALRALLGDRVRLSMVAPNRALNHRPSSPLEAVERQQPKRYELAAVARDLRCEHHVARLESVSPRVRQVRTDSGIRLGYDALIVATGAAAVVAVPGALTFHDRRDGARIAEIGAEVEAGRIRRVVFAVPLGCSWPLPLYELALLTERRARRAGVEAEIWLVTPERRPLKVFGPELGRLVADLLEERGVRFVGGAAPSGVGPDGSLTLQNGGAIEADRVVAVPALRGRRITGIPASWWGFVPTDASGRVEGLAGVYAAGDMTTYPVKQGGLATQQADRIAQTIAFELGVTVNELRPRNILQARLVGGEHPIILRTELDALGQPTAAWLERPDRRTDAQKVFGRYLTPYLETLEPRSTGTLAA